MDIQQIERARTKLAQDESLLTRTFQAVSDAAGRARNGETAVDIDHMLAQLGGLRRIDAAYGRPVVSHAEQLLAAEAALARLNDMIAKQKVEADRAEANRQRCVADGRAALLGVHQKGRHDDLRHAAFALIERTKAVADRIARPNDHDVGEALEDFAAALASASAALGIARREHRIDVSASALRAAA